MMLRSRTKIRCAFWASVATVHLLLVVTSLTVWWMLLDYEVNPVDEQVSETYISRRPFGEPAMDFYAGETVFFNYFYKKLRKCDNKFEPSFYNKTSKAITQLDSHHGFFRRDEESYSVAVVLPEELLPNGYEYRIRGVLRCNPLRAFVTDYQPVEFRIVE